LIQVEIDVPDLVDVAFCSAACALFQSVHADVDVVSRSIPLLEPLLKIGGCDLLR